MEALTDFYFPNNTKNKKGRPFDLPFQYPLRGSTALLAVSQSCAHFIYTLPTSLKGRRSRVLAPEDTQKTKKEDLSIFLFSTPSGARTLDPNIKSVVLYQLS